jgi:methylenetetrahydrofolate reductase (NADPH)
MSPGTHSTATDDVSSLLEDPRFELMPFDSFGEQMAHLPEGATITVTASPSLGIEPTVEWTERAGEAGYDAVPHLAARYVEDREELAEYVDRLQDVGVTDIFVPGGDREEPKGEFESAYELLVALEELGYEFDEVGITGYPEGHHFLSDETLAGSMDRKAPYATYITTQICYDPQTVLDWIERVRDHGVSLPVEVGVPGVMKYQRLLNISRQFGVGDSIEFLEKTGGILDFVRRFVGSGGKFTPDELVDGLGPYADDDYGIRGLNIYTFNRVPDTEDWRREQLRG